MPSLLHPLRSILYFSFALLLFGCGPNANTANNQPDQPKTQTQPQQSSPQNNAPRRVENGKMVSTIGPAMTFFIPSGLAFLADTSLVFDGKSNAEIFLFVEARQGQVSRFLQFQFGHLNPGVEKLYEYEMRDSSYLQDVPFGKNYWCEDLISHSLEVPNSDVATVQRMMRRSNLFCTGLFAGQRYVYVGPNKQTELLIIYGEKTSLRNIDCANEQDAFPKMVEMDYKLFQSLDKEG